MLVWLAPSVGIPSFDSYHQHSFPSNDDALEQTTLAYVFKVHDLAAMERDQDEALNFKYWSSLSPTNFRTADFVRRYLAKYTIQANERPDHVLDHLYASDIQQGSAMIINKQIGTRK